jgi:hypothetical protein
LQVMDVAYLGIHCRGALGLSAAKHGVNKATEVTLWVDATLVPTRTCVTALSVPSYLVVDKPHYFVWSRRVWVARSVASDQASNAPPLSIVT